VIQIKFIIEKVGDSTISERTGKVFNFWIIGRLDSGKTIKIQDRLPFNLRKYEDKKVDCLLIATFIHHINMISEKDEIDIAHPVIKGEYIGEYEIPSKWLNCSGYKIISGYHAVKSIDGIFLIDPSDFERQEVIFNSGNEIIFKAGSIELDAWLPIEEDDELPIDEQEPDLMLEIEPQDFIEKFWKLTETYREKDRGDKWDRMQFFIDGIKEWTLEEMLLFDEMHYYLTSLLRENFELIEIFGHFSDDRWNDFCMGIVILGKKAYRDASTHPEKFYEDVMNGAYGEKPRYIEIELYGIGAQTLEKVKCASVSELVDSVFDKAFDKTFEKIKELLNKEFLG
jgi:hypothetical protein